MDLYWNAVKRTLTLGQDKITLRINNPVTADADNATETTFQYKIVLMKIVDED